MKKTETVVTIGFKRGPKAEMTVKGTRFDQDELVRLVKKGARILYITQSRWTREEHEVVWENAR